MRPTWDGQDVARLGGHDARGGRPVGVRILVTAPSLPAADVLTERLGAAVNAAVLLAAVRVTRLNPPARPVADARLGSLR